jgi:cytochrome c553
MEKILKWLGVAFILALLSPLIIMFLNSFKDEDTKVTALNKKDDMSAKEFYNSKCSVCHGNNGDGTEGNPRLNKLTSNDLSLKLKNYKYATGSKGIMNIQASSISDNMIDELAKYISSLTPIERVEDNTTKEKKLERKFTTEMNS